MTQRNDSPAHFSFVVVTSLLCISRELHALVRGVRVRGRGIFHFSEVGNVVFISSSCAILSVASVSERCIEAEVRKLRSLGIHFFYPSANFIRDSVTAARTLLSPESSNLLVGRCVRRGYICFSYASRWASDDQLMILLLLMISKSSFASIPRSLLEGDIWPAEVLMSTG